MFLKRFRVAAVRVGRLPAEHGPGAERLPQQVPLGTRPVVAPWRDDTPGGAEVIDELDEVIFGIEKIIVEGEIVVAVEPVVDSLLSIISPVGDGIRQHHRAAGIGRVRARRQLDGITESILVGVGIVGVRRGVAIDLVEVRQAIII